MGWFGLAGREPWVNRTLREAPLQQAWVSLSRAALPAEVACVSGTLQGDWLGAAGEELWERSKSVSSQVGGQKGPESKARRDLGTTGDRLWGGWLGNYIPGGKTGVILCTLGRVGKTFFITSGLCIIMCTCTNSAQRWDLECILRETVISFFGREKGKQGQAYWVYHGLPQGGTWCVGHSITLGFQVFIFFMVKYWKQTLSSLENTRAGHKLTHLLNLMIKWGGYINISCWGYPLWYEVGVIYWEGGFEHHKNHKFLVHATQKNHIYCYSI